MARNVLPPFFCQTSPFVGVVVGNLWRWKQDLLAVASIWVAFVSVCESAQSIKANRFPFVSRSASSRVSPSLSFFFFRFFWFCLVWVDQSFSPSLSLPLSLTIAIFRGSLSSNRSARISTEQSGTAKFCNVQTHKQ